MKQIFSLITLVAAFPVFAEDVRELDAHEHGVGTLNIAINGTTVAMGFEAPGADIVGFEYAAESDTDLAKIDAAVTTLGAPLDLFVMPSTAGCTLVEAQAALEGEDDHDEHADEGHDDHEDHSDEDHAEHADKASHTEFHAEYTLTCENADAVIEITFAYFEAFPNAQEVEVQMITASGAQAFEVTRDAPILDLER